MKTAIINSKLEIFADVGEDLEVFRNTVYRDRIVVFKTAKSGVIQECHFDDSTGHLLERDKRRLTLPKFEYTFDEYQIVGVIEHRFLDELEFNGFKPKGIDIETIVVKLFKNGHTINSAYHMHPVNKFPNEYYKIVKKTVYSYIETERAKKENLTFLQETYSKWSSEEKANYHYGQILFQDRMQGGFPSIYKNPAADYLSKWFIDTFQKYDNNILFTLELIANSFSIDTTHLPEMIKYDTKSEDWKRIANKLNLMT